MAFIISEIGVNWNGDLTLLEEMMKVSKEAGCNAVKLQAFQEDIVKDHPQKNSLMKSSVNNENIEQINKLSKTIGIEWFCTPMYPEAVELLEPFVQRYKIRELDGRSLLDNEISTLFKRVLETEKEIIVSSQQSPKKSKFYNDPKIKWLYCVPKYPCNISDLDFRMLKDFNGLSNHCPHIIAPLSAVILGAEIVEIHITQEKSKKFIDSNVSFDFVELKKLMELISLCKKMKL